DASTGRIEMLYAGDQAHTGFDNIAFLSDTTLTAVEDAGDTLHGQRNALDSGYVFTLAGEGPGHRSQPIRWLAEGRDPSATLDAANAGFGKNDGDNEITGVTASDGDPSPGGILGAKRPQPFTDPAWRWFYTQQHGDNATFEVVASTPVRDRGTNGG
ncbi:MAG: phosphatase-like protein, partial [Solirubrobacterales bacterium]|nr:phosphatase-like protein [Solirubrobacterales bacterium]